MKKLITILFTICITLCLQKRADAQAGTLDNTFGVGGKVVTDSYSGNDNQAFATIIQADGKILVAGYSKGLIWYQFTIFRYNTDGSLDNTFGNQGKVYTSIGIYTSIATAIAMQSDQKIIVVGYGQVSSKLDFAIARYNADGTLDNTFGIGGIVTTDFGGENDYATSVAIGSDGKIIVAGVCLHYPSTNFAVARYNTNGILDYSFGIGGKLTTLFPGLSSGTIKIEIQPNGKIIAGGGGTDYINNFIALARYNYNGSLDFLFGNGGKVTTNIGVGSGADDLALQDDGRILVSGATSISGSQKFILARYLVNGNLDNSFGTLGKVIFDGGSGDCIGGKIEIQRDSKIVLSGTFSEINSKEKFIMIRFNTFGKLDNSFGNNGIDKTQVGNGGCTANALALQNDDKIIVVGTAWDDWLQPDFALARYNSDVSTITEANPPYPLSLSPNPASSLLAVSYELSAMSKGGEITITNLTGKEIIHIPTSAQQTNIDISLLRAGVYIVTLKTDEGREFAKFVKQ